MKFRSFALIAAVALLLGVANQAKAAVMHFSASGTWDAGAPSSTFSAPSATWSFSFDLPSTLTSNPTTAFSNFSYLLNGVSLPNALTSIEFFHVNDGGLFALNFAGGGFIGMFGDQVGGPFGELNGPAGTPPYTLLAGNYTVFQINTSGPNGFATGSGELEVSQTPLPAAWTMMIAGVAGYGFFARRRARKQAALATA